MNSTITILGKIKLLIGIACLVASSLKAQDPAIISGYYLTPKGDSISGQINTDKTGGNVLRFRETGQKKWKNVSTEQATKAGGQKGYDLLQVEIRSSQDSERVFIQKIAGDGYNLYEGKSDNWGKVFYINSKDKTTPIRINKMGYGSQLRVMFGKCSAIAKPSNLRYGRSPLQRYVADLNRCDYPDEKPYSFYHKSKFVFGIGLNAYYYTINPNVTGGYFEANYHRFSKPGLGITFKVKFAKALSLYAGLNYVEKKSVSDSLHQELYYWRVEPGQAGYLAHGFYNYALKMEFKFLEIPIGATYDLFPFAKWSPIFHIGYSILRPMKTKTANDLGYPLCEDEILCAHIPKEPGHLYYTEESIFKKPSLANFFGGVGIRRHLNPSNEIELRGDYFNQKEEILLGSSRVFTSTISRRLQLSLAYHYFFHKKT